ncbi:MAG: CHASE2 domain-containing protein [Elainellaceae cyanobacterium]
MSTLGKLVVLKLEGDLEQQGFRVSLEVGTEGQRPDTETVGYLPPNVELATCVVQWQQNYRRLGTVTRITPQEIIYNGSINQLEDFRQSADELRDRLSAWLESKQFLAIDRRLREVLNLSDPIRVLIRTQDRRVCRLPWHLWDFIERYHQAEVSFGSLSFESIQRTPASAQNTVRILAILGDSTGINIDDDRRLLETLPGAEVIFLVEPQRWQINDQLWEQSWDILFFAGHSYTETNAGRIHINAQDSLTLDELKYGLRQAVERGLQLAIFNSCDGMGLAYELEQVCLPQLIVMREPVPDQVAQKFLKYFLEAFATGNSFYLATRNARERLQGLEGLFPCASWLPVIYQNPDSIPPRWFQLQGVETANRLRTVYQTSPRVESMRWQRLRMILVGSALVTSLVIGMRSLGILQHWELQAFDQFMRLRPNIEGIDSRILIVSVEEEDIQYQQIQGMKMIGSLSDEALLQLLKKLEPYQPAVVASDIIHDFAYAPDLAVYLQQMGNFVGICRIRVSDQLPGVEPPPLPITNIGFTNVPLDPDGVIRRQILKMPADEICPTNQSFNMRTIQQYIQSTTDYSLYWQPDGRLQIGSMAFRRLEPDAGGYQLPQREVSGQQILINYRGSNPDQISLRELLSQSLDVQLSELVRDRIVLIGVVSPNIDVHLTPYSSDRGTDKMSGVIVQAHMISQILSAVFDQRPLIKWWSSWTEILWITSWSVIGSAIVLYPQSRWKVGFTILLVWGALVGVCFLLFIQGWWVPLIPAMLALAITAVNALLYAKFKLR